MTRLELEEPIDRVRVRDDEATYAAFKKFVEEKGIIIPGGLGLSDQRFSRVHSHSLVRGLLNPPDPIAYAMTLMNIPGEAGDRRYNEKVTRANRRSRVVRRQVRDFIEAVPCEE